jgi:hypothetical protein
VCAGRPQPQTSTALTSTVNKAAIETWDWQTTVNFLNERGYNAYAAHFQTQLNGMALLAVDPDDINDMPEKSSLKRKAFTLLLNSLHK